MDLKLNKIKICLLNIISDVKSEETIEYTDCLETIDCNEMNIEDLLEICIPFINGYNKNSKEELIDFIEKIFKISIFETKEEPESKNIDFFPTNLDLFKKNAILNSEQEFSFDPVKTFEKIKKGILEREDKIHMSRKISNFNVNFVDWESKEFLKELIEICFYKAIVKYRTIKNEENIVMNKDKNEQITVEKPKAFTLMKCGHLNPVSNVRKDLLKRRINPNMTMDEYVKSVMESAKERENKPAVTVKKDLEYLRREDERKEKEKNFRGNVNNKS